MKSRQRMYISTYIILFCTGDWYLAQSHMYWGVQMVLFSLLNLTRYKLRTKASRHSRLERQNNAGTCVHHLKKHHKVCQELLVIPNRRAWHNFLPPVSSILRFALADRNSINEQILKCSQLACSIMALIMTCKESAKSPDNSVFRRSMVPLFSGEATRLQQVAA